MGWTEDYCALFNVKSRDLFTSLPTVSTFNLDPSSRWKGFDVKLGAEHSSGTSMIFNQTTCHLIQ